MSIWDGRFYSGPIKYDLFHMNQPDFRGMGWGGYTDINKGTQMIMPGYEYMLRNALIRPNLQAQQNQKQVQQYGTQLGNISDILNKPPARPTAPGLTGTTQPNYVSSDRLNMGKGYSKFFNQAKGTDQFDQIRQLVQGIKTTGPTDLYSMAANSPAWQDYLQKTGQQDSPELLRQLLGELFPQ